jgi:hypothetical protein
MALRSITSRASTPGSGTSTRAAKRLKAASSRSQGALVAAMTTIPLLLLLLLVLLVAVVLPTLPSWWPEEGSPLLLLLLLLLLVVWWVVVWMPSMKDRNSLATRRLVPLPPAASPPARLASRESTSSMNSTAGALRARRLNSCRTLASLSPYHLDRMLLPGGVGGGVVGGGGV